MSRLFGLNHEIAWWASQEEKSETQVCPGLVAY